MDGMRTAVRAMVVKDDALLVMHRNKFGKEYYTLIGGAVKPHETNEQALTRELREEAGIVVTAPTLVIVEEAGQPFGTQFVYWCEYHSGTPALSADSEEAKIGNAGNNTYRPEWLPIERLADVTFVTPQLQKALIKGILNGFSSRPLELNSVA